MQSFLKFKVFHNSLGSKTDWTDIGKIKAWFENPPVSLKGRDVFAAADHAGLFYTPDTGNKTK